MPSSRILDSKVPYAPPAYTPSQTDTLEAWYARDPRNSSTQSLVPSLDEGGNDPGHVTRRTLLIIYIHGFYGNDESFRSFPAHVHAFLRSALADSHVIHSKIYPRYKTYRAITVARDNFSAWLEPHESPSTDVILVGHSMGGLLAADVALMPNTDPQRQHRFKHHLIGTISLDSPFLGLHPGIIGAGISSLFRSAPPAPEAQENPPSSSLSPIPMGSPSPSLYPSESTSSVPLSPSSSQPYADQQPDPTFNPSFSNDKPFKEQPFIKSMMHFYSKHKSKGVFNAMRSHALSHLEYGGCLLDYASLKSRYNRIRGLEDIDEMKLVGEGHSRKDYARVRFVNYYTASTGRPKAPESAPSTPAPEAGGEHTDALPNADGESHLDAQSQRSRSRSGSDASGPLLSRAATPTIVMPDNAEPLSRENTADPQAHRNDADPAALSTLQQSISSLTVDGPQSTPGSSLEIADLPAAPVPPALPSLEGIHDEEERKEMEGIVSRLQKSHEQAEKTYAKVVKEKQKALDKERRKADKAAREAERQQQRKRDKQDKMRVVNEDDQRIHDDPAGSVASSSHQSRPDTAPQASSSSSSADAQPTATTVAASSSATAPQAPQDAPAKLRKFCNVPSSRSSGASGDAAWVAVRMEGMDEVGAHCGLFLPGPHYERLVGDVGSRVVGWVHDDMSTRAVLDMYEAGS